MKKIILAVIVILVSITSFAGVDAEIVQNYEITKSVILNFQEYTTGYLEYNLPIGRYRVEISGLDTSTMHLDDVIVNGELFDVSKSSIRISEQNMEFLLNVTPDNKNFIQGFRTTTTKGKVFVKITKINAAITVDKTAVVKLAGEGVIEYNLKPGRYEIITPNNNILDKYIMGDATENLPEIQKNKRKYSIDTNKKEKFTQEYKI